MSGRVVGPQEVEIHDSDLSPSNLDDSARFQAIEFAGNSLAVRSNARRDFIMRWCWPYHDALPQACPVGRQANQLAADALADGKRADLEYAL